jgi:hypothetical protein
MKKIHIRNNLSSNRKKISVVGFALIALAIIIHRMANPYFSQGVRATILLIVIIMASVALVVLALKNFNGSGK